MNRTNIRLILQREYLVQVRKRTFLILTFLAPFLIMLFVGIAVFLVSGAMNESSQVMVWDGTGKIAPQLQSDDQVKFEILDNQKPLEFYKKELNLDEKNYLLIIPKYTVTDSVENQISIFSKGSASSTMTSNLENQLEKIFTKEKTKEAGIDYDLMEKTRSNVTLQILNEANEDVSLEIQVARAVSGLSFFLMYFFVFVYGARVMRSVMEEKTSRVVELVLSSVKPRELMIGKILGSTLVSFTQFAIWILMALLATSLVGVFIGDAANVSSADASSTDIAGLLAAASNLNLGTITFSFILYFLLGFLIYSSLFAAIGSIVDNQQDSQQFLMPLVIPMMLTLYASFGIIQNPDSSMAVWLSIIPLTSPIAMMARIPFGVPAWQWILSVVMLVALLIFTIRLAGKLYRIGILTQRGKPTYKEIWKWLRQ